MSLIPSDLRHEAIQADLDILSDDKNTKAMMNRVAIAKSLGIDERFAIGGISRINVTNQHPPDPPVPAARPSANVPATTPQAVGLSALAKTAIGAALAFGTGGVGTAAWALLSQSPPAAVAPAAPSGQVTIGINADGTLYDPSKGGQP